jgi:hypothetical protein
VVLGAHRLTEQAGSPSHRAALHACGSGSRHGDKAQFVGIDVVEASAGRVRGDRALEQTDGEIEALRRGVQLVQFLERLEHVR